MILFLVMNLKVDFSFKEVCINWGFRFSMFHEKLDLGNGFVNKFHKIFKKSHTFDVFFLVYLYFV